MLQLKIKNIDFARLSKVLAKYQIKASISKDSIVLDGNISNELLTELYNNGIEILSIHKATQLELVENKQTLYPCIKTGEVYLCDFGTPYGCEIGGCRPAIVVSNNYIGMNPHCNIVTVVPCTTSLHEHPSQLTFDFSMKNMTNYSKDWLDNSRPSSALTNQMRSVEKARFIKYLARMTPDFMNELHNVISYTLNSDLTTKE